MKKRTIISLLGMSFALALGAVGAHKVGERIQFKKAEATSTATKCIPTSDGSFYYRAYFNDDKWTSGNAKIWGYFWDNDSHTCWTPACVNTDDNLIYYDSSSNSSYYVVVPEDTSHTWTGAQLVRFDSSSATTRNTEWDRTVNITFGNTFNCVGPQEYGSTYTTAIYNVNYFEAGSTYYLDLSNGNYDWLADNHKIYGHLYTGNLSTSSTDVELTQVLGFSNNFLYQLVIPNTSDYFRLIFHRGTTSSGYSNQTDTLYVNTTNNVFKLSNTEGAGTWDWSEPDSDRANYFGKYFNTCVVCSGSGSITTDNWTNASNEFDTLSESVKTIVRNAEEDENGTDLEKAMSKYDYIAFYKKYASHGDFIERKDSSANSYGSSSKPLAIINENNTASTIIIVISTLSIASLGLFLFLKKRKEER